MPKTAIITDTDASLPVELARKYDITQVPIMVQFGEQSLKAVYDLDDAETFRRVDREGKLPTTSAPSPGQFQLAFQEAFDKGYDDILCLTVSSAVSTTYNSALNAADLFPGRTIKVFDTQTLAIDQGFQVLAAAQVMHNGAPLQNALAAAEDVRSRSKLFASLSTLKYLAMSGRIGYLAAGIATLFDVKPILTVRNGKLEMLERVRTQNKSWERMIELVVSHAAGKIIEQVAMVHVDALENAKTVEKHLRNYLPIPDDVLYTNLTPGLSVHSGSGLVGVAFVTAQE